MVTPPMRRAPGPRLVSTLAAVALAVSLGGCVSLLPKTKPAQLYRFGGPETATAAPAPANPTLSGAAKTGVVLATIGFPRASTSDGILTVTGDETAYLAGARWVAPARLLFQEAVQRAFQTQAARAQLVDVGDAGPAGAILRIDVTDFEARYPTPGSPVVVVGLSARLTRSNGEVLDQRAFTAVQPADANSVSAIVRAFDRATGKALTDLTGWTDEGVARIPVTPPNAPPSTAVTTYSHSSVTTTTTTDPH